MKPLELVPLSLKTQIHNGVWDENISRSSLALRALITFFCAVNTGLFQLRKDSFNNEVVLINRSCKGANFWLITPPISWNGTAFQPAVFSSLLKSHCSIPLMTESSSWQFTRYSRSPCSCLPSGFWFSQQLPLFLYLLHSQE